MKRLRCSPGREEEEQEQEQPPVRVREDAQGPRRRRSPSPPLGENGEEEEEEDPFRALRENVSNAIRSSRADVVELMISGGEWPVDESLEAQMTWTGLMEATFSDEIIIARLFLSFGASVHARDSLQNTPLHFCKSYDMVELLLENKADPRLRNNASLTPFGSLRRNFGNRDPRITLLYSQWTPWKLLPIWSPETHRVYIEYCPGFAAAVRAVLLVLLRKRQYISRFVGMQIIIQLAEIHRIECCWEIVGFSNLSLL